MAQPKPNIGDIWYNVLGKYYFLVMDKYIEKSRNTHVLLLKNLQTGKMIILEAVYVREKWEFIS
jgi:hypothetical protein